MDMLEYAQARYDEWKRIHDDPETEQSWKHHCRSAMAAWQTAINNIKERRNAEA